MNSLLVCVCVLSHVATLYDTRLLCAWDSPDKNTGVGCHWVPFPPPGDLPDAGIELASAALAGGFFTISATWEALIFTYVHLKFGLDLWERARKKEVRKDRSGRVGGGGLGQGTSVRSLSTYEGHSQSFCKPDLPRFRSYRCYWFLHTGSPESKRKRLPSGLSRSQEDL